MLKDVRHALGCFQKIDRKRDSLGMKMVEKSAWMTCRPAALLAFGAAVGIIAFHLGYAYLGFPAYRDQHLGTALTYAWNGIDLLRPIIVGFNANNAPTPLEFPLWQAAAALPLRWFGEWFGWANIVSLMIFATALYPTYQVGKDLGGREAGWWTMALLLMQPIIWVQAGAASTDGTSLAATIWFFYSGSRLLRGEDRTLWTVTTALSGALAATLKLPFMLAAGIALGLLLLFQHERELKTWIAMSTSAGFAAIVFLVWTKYTDGCLAQAEFPFVELRLSHNPEMVWWYFGDWHYRLNPANWIKGAWRALNGLFGSFALVAVPLAAFGLRRSHPAALALLAGAFAVTCVFSHLILHHQHYFLMYSLPVALLMAPMAGEGWRRIETAWRWPKPLVFLLMLTTALLSVLQGLVGLEAVHQDPYHASVVQRLREHTSSHDKLLIIEGGWGGNYLFLAGRQGLSIWSADLLQNGDNLRRLRELGYSKLVAFSESPLMTALQTTNPGNAGNRRRTYENALTSQSRGWPTIYQDDDLLIKLLPE